MKDRSPIRLDERISLIDGYDMDIPNRTGTYVINEEALTLVETGPSPSIKYVKKGLEELGFKLEDVKYIIVTHIHLDHSGGAGYLLEDCPNAKIVVHPRGKRHLIEPSKLAAGARAIYGESFSDLFDPIVPVPEERILVKTEGDTLDISSNCTLKFFDTPGHSKHHFSIYDPISNGIFTGDTVGIFYQQLLLEGIEFYLPTTSPNHFNPNDMQDSIRRVKEMNVGRIYFGHFGMTENTEVALNEVSKWLDIFMEEGEQVRVENKGYDVLAQRMLGRVKEYLKEKGLPDDHEAYIIINLDMQVCALGIIDYFQKIKQ